MTTTLTTPTTNTTTRTRAPYGRLLLVNLGATVAAGVADRGLGRDRAGRGRRPADR